MAGAEVVDREAQPARVELGEDRRDRRPSRAGRRLGDLDHHAGRARGRTTRSCRARGASPSAARTPAAGSPTRTGRAPRRARRAPWRQASSTTHSEIGAIRPVRSASGMKSPGMTRPRSPSCQRIERLDADDRAGRRGRRAAGSAARTRSRSTARRRRPAIERRAIASPPSRGVELVRRRGRPPWPGTSRCRRASAGWPRRRRRPGWMLMPTLRRAVDLGAGELERRRRARRAACSATRASRRCRRRRRRAGRSRSARRIRNSSPPWRATMSRAADGLAQPRRDLVRSSSPAAWPRLSLTSLKSSRSTKSTATPRPVALGPRERDVEVLAEHGAVGQAGERVVVGEVRELLLGRPCSGDVEQVALPVQRLAVGVAHDDRLVVHPHDGAVGPHDPVLAHERRAVEPGRLEAVEHAARSSSWMILAKRSGILLPLGVRVAGDDVVLGAVVERRAALVERVDVDGERQLLDERAVAVLGIAERASDARMRLLGLLALGDLVDHAVDLVGTAAVGRHGDGLVVEPARRARTTSITPVLERERLAVLDRPRVRRDGSRRDRRGGSGPSMPSGFASHSAAGTPMTVSICGLT